MGRLFQALGNIWRGFVSILISDVAVSNPEATYAGIIQKRIEEREKLTRAAGQVAGVFNQQRSKLERARTELADIERQLAVAVRTGNQQVGAVLIKKKHLLERTKAELEPQVATLKSQVEKCEADLRRFTRSIHELKEEARTNVARLRNAEAMRRVMGLFDGLSTEGDEQMLSSLRESIEAKVGEVDMLGRVSEATDIDAQLERVRDQAEGDASASEFAQLRAAYDAQHGGAQTETTAAPGSGTDGSGGKQA